MSLFDLFPPLPFWHDGGCFPFWNALQLLPYLGGSRIFPLVDTWCNASWRYICWVVSPSIPCISWVYSRRPLRLLLLYIGLSQISLTLLLVPHCVWISHTVPSLWSWMTIHPFNGLFHWHYHCTNVMCCIVRTRLCMICGLHHVPCCSTC